MLKKRLISYLFIFLLNVPALIALSTCFENSGYALAGTCGSSTSSCLNRSGQGCTCTCPSGVSRNGTCSRSASVCNPRSACPPPSPSPGCFDDSSCPAGQFCYQLSNTRICYPVCTSNSNGVFCRGSYCQYGQCTQTGPNSCVCNTPSPSPTPPPTCNDGEKRCSVSRPNPLNPNEVYPIVEECRNGDWVEAARCSNGANGSPVEICRENPDPHCEPNTFNCGNDRFEGCENAPVDGFQTNDGICTPRYETRPQSNGGTCCCPTPTPPIDCSNSLGDPNANPPVPRGDCASAPSGGSVLVSGQSCPSGTNPSGNCCCPTPYPRVVCNIVPAVNICPPGAAPGSNWRCCSNPCCSTDSSKCGCPTAGRTSLCADDPACFGIGSPSPTSTPTNSSTPTPTPTPTPTSTPIQAPCSSFLSSNCPLGRCILTAGGCSEQPSANSIQINPSSEPESEIPINPSSESESEIPSSFDTMYP